MKNKLLKTIRETTLFGEICSDNISGDKPISKNNNGILWQGSGPVQLTVNNYTPEDEKRSINTSKTNFDAIRELSIDQLVDILFVANYTLHFCPPGSVCRNFPTCCDCVLHWLRSPVDLYKYVNKQHSN